MSRRSATVVPFASVNRRGDCGYREGWQRHHLVPNEIRHHADLRPFWERLTHEGFSLDDFETNGLLLPAFESVARSSQLPLHFGGHAHYNRVVGDCIQAIRNSCEVIRRDRVRQKLAVMRVRQLRCELRRAIARQGSGSIDIVLAGPTDCDIDAIIRTFSVFRNRHRSE
jgi:hypothetical protein